MLQIRAPHPIHSSSSFNPNPLSATFLLQAAIEKMFKDSCAIDLAFMSDATSSMDPWIEAVANQITSIAADVTARYGVDGRQVGAPCNDKEITCKGKEQEQII
jgi:hypothetical protein